MKRRAEVTAILIAARLAQLRRLAADTTATFADMQRSSTPPAVEIAPLMERHLEACRARPRAVLILRQLHLRKALARCLVRKP
jgi:hypothetical protein